MMNNDSHPLSKLSKLIEKNGIECLLPQKLADEFLGKMLREADALGNDTTEETPPSMLFMAILHLKSKSIIREKVEIKMAEGELMEYFGIYVATLKFESMRRKKDIEIPSESLPTIENIFDTKRNVDIVWLR